MSTVDPLESINRQLSEALIKALDAPMRAFVTRNQEALQRPLAAPLAELARLQDQTGRTLAPPIARLIEQSQPMIQSAIRGPLLPIAEASEEAIQTALEVPLRQLERHQEAIGAALAGPFVAIARNQELMRVVMEAAASAADSQRESHASDLTEAEQIAWLEEWKTAIAGWTPTWEQVEVLGAGLAVSEPGLTGRDGVTGMSPKRSRRSSLGVVEAIVDLPATRRSRGIALVADALVG